MAPLSRCVASPDTPTSLRDRMLFWRQSLAGCARGIVGLAHAILVDDSSSGMRDSGSGISD
jgi:hypothetical protein